ncbi:hypothetical protein B0H14DRAFT_35246 [Mycena olivaceomarginata]|nr:hypothetical protein B0H14DRAFT_35246 [Mycena olivaceomarginata]
MTSRVRASWRIIAFVLSLFSHLASSAVVVRSLASMESETRTDFITPRSLLSVPSPSVTVIAQSTAGLHLSVVTGDSSPPSSATTITIAVSVAIGVTGTIILAVFLVLYTRNRRALKQAKISVAPSPPGISNPFDDSASESEFGVANRESWVPYLDGFQTRRGSTRASLNTISTRTTAHFQPD